MIPSRDSFIVTIFLTTNVACSLPPDKPVIKSGSGASDADVLVGAQYSGDAVSPVNQTTKGVIPGNAAPRTDKAVAKPPVGSLADSAPCETRF
ncbi:MAG: hypothetical protein H7249_02700 [Chitinophagaceae bacterium]|nr:hypothetical protein [Oligoflexus sp.]